MNTIHAYDELDQRIHPRHHQTLEIPHVRLLFVPRGWLRGAHPVGSSSGGAFAITGWWVTASEGDKADVADSVAGVLAREARDPSVKTSLGIEDEDSRIRRGRGRRRGRRDGRVCGNVRRAARTGERGRRTVVYRRRGLVRCVCHQFPHSGDN